MDEKVSRLEEALFTLFTRVRISRERVQIDACDFLPLLLLGGLVVPVALALLSSPLKESALLLGACALATTRIHVAVHLGHVRVVRSVLWVPWSIRTYGASVHDVSLDADGTHLRVGDEEWPACALSAAHHLVRVEELKTIHAACARLLA